MRVIPFNPERLGIHYFTDAEYYTTEALSRWLPRIKSLGFRWLTLRAPETRSIPEDFLEMLHAANLRPIVHLPLSLKNPPSADEVQSMLNAYANWGVRYVAFFDRPNLRSRWPDTGWTQRGLVERFLNVFSPLAEAAIDAGLSPVFPPLEPGGDYWDTAFLRAALEQMAERSEDMIRDHLTIGAYAWADHKELDWGIGGPENWPATLPYQTPEGSQDQRGFRIFDWYNAISSATVGRHLPMIILGAGEAADAAQTANIPSGRNVAMAKQAALFPTEQSRAGMPDNVLACNFWLLAANEGRAETARGWFDADGRPRPVVAQWLAWKQGQGTPAARINGTQVAPGLTS
ncbi:MAG: hypothetical protein DWG76_01280 [Chloroflexi bacterium]|nr:hypothetical protein [Chloroflexota bacterium]